MGVAPATAGEPGLDRASLGSLRGTPLFEGRFLATQEKLSQCRRSEWEFATRLGPSTGCSIAMMTFAVGDVHGCVDKLVGLVAQCLRHAGDQPSRFVFIGDYIDRGPDSRAVIDFVMAMQRQSPEVIALRGNHEAMMLNAVRTGDGALWLLNGAAQTLASYGVTGWTGLPTEHVDWVAALPL